MPKERKPQTDVLFELKELSNEADDLIAKNISATKFPGLDEWFEAARNVVLQIRDCGSIVDITYPKISVFGEEARKVTDTATVSEAQRVHVHANVQSAATTEHETSEVKPAISVIDDKSKSSGTNKKSNKSVVTPANKSVVTPANKGVVTPANKSVVTPAVSISANLQPVVLLQKSTPIVKKTDSSVCVSDNNACGSQNLMQTPMINRTFNAAINKTLVLDSQTSSSSCQKTKILNGVYNDSGIKIKPDSKHLMANKLLSHSSGMVTRSGSKRKSTTKSKSSKKQKTEMPEITTANKAAHARYPLADKNSRVIAYAPEYKNKVTAVIMPTMQKKSVVSKEEIIREEIKKKDEKANENIKRVLAERQMKAEQIKKKREDKRTKTLQKRIQMEKEKEEKEKERLQKVELENKKSQAKTKASHENVKNGVIKTRTQELIEQHVKTSISGALSSSKQNVPNGNALEKTPVQKKLDDCQSYEITPLPNSSTYDFSDSDDENAAAGKVGKAIPLWAVGIHLKSALIQQYYNPPDVIELFGKHIDSPDLTEMFSVTKKNYLKRTSSAVWNSPPSLRH